MLMLDVVKHGDRNVMQNEIENKIQGFMYRDTTNLARKTFSRFTTKDGYTRIITHDTESIAV